MRAAPPLLLLASALAACAPPASGPPIVLHPSPVERTDARDAALERLYREKRYFDLRDSLAARPAAGDAPLVRFLRGAMANKLFRTEESDRLLGAPVRWTVLRRPLAKLRGAHPGRGLPMWASARPRRLHTAGHRTGGGQMTQERKEGPFEQLGQTVGGAVGKMAGRAHDTAMNAAGSLLGAAMSQLGQWWGSQDAQRAAGSWSEDTDRRCRTHFESRSGVGAAGYENARPTYQFGHLAGQNPDYQGKPFDQVEAELERTWETAGKAQHGPWTDVRDRVSFGYETVRTPGAPNPT